jgi:hypothetical protein
MPEQTGSLINPAGGLAFSLISNPEMGEPYASRSGGCCFRPQHDLPGVAGMKRSPRFSQILYTLSLAVLVFGLFNLAWGVWPSPTDAVQITIPAGILPAAPEGKPFASLSEYALNVSWTRWVRQGESGTLHLVLTDLEHEPLPSGTERQAQVVLAEPVLYPLRLNPLGGVQATLGDDQELLLAWEAAGEQQGSFPGKIYVSFGFFEEETDALVDVPVVVVDIHIQVVEMWGSGAGTAIWIGLVSLLLWGALFVLGRLSAARRGPIGES